MVNVVSDGGMYVTEIQNHIGLVKDAFQKLNKLLRTRKFFLNENKIVLNVHVIISLLYSKWLIKVDIKY